MGVCAMKPPDHLVLSVIFILFPFPFVLAGGEVVLHCGFNLHRLDV